jgi:hypothetical protein
MKYFITAIMLSFATLSIQAAEPAKKDAPAVQNDNCVKKDKNGKCPPLPNSPKPTPKKKAESEPVKK